jgi:hypothetical protein
MFADSASRCRPNREGSVRPTVRQGPPALTGFMLVQLQVFPFPTDNNFLYRWNLMVRSLSPMAAIWRRAAHLIPLSGPGCWRRRPWRQRGVQSAQPREIAHRKRVQCLWARKVNSTGKAQGALGSIKSVSIEPEHRTQAVKRMSGIREFSSAIPLRKLTNLRSSNSKARLWRRRSLGIQITWSLSPSRMKQMTTETR